MKGGYFDVLKEVSLIIIIYIDSLFYLFFQKQKQ